METRKEKIEKILDGSPTRLRESFFIKNYPELSIEIDNYTSHIIDISFKERLWYYVNNITDDFLCKCGNKTTFNKNWLNGYRIYCSTKCSHGDDSTKEKRKMTTITKYGVDNIAKLDSIKKKTEETNIERYGYKSSFQNSEVKEKYKRNIKEKYGVDYIFQLDSFKEKNKKVNLEKYGKEYFSQTEEYKNRCIKTNQIKYNVDWYTQTNEYKEKSLKTNLEKYGVIHYSKTNEYKERVRFTNNDKYDKDWYCQSSEFKEKTKETNLEKRGVDHHTKDFNFKESTKLSNINKYGVDSIYKYEKFRKNNYKISNDINYIRYLRDNVSLFKCDRGHTFEINQLNYHGRQSINTQLCTICHPISENSSIKEKVLLEYIKSIYSGEVISGYRDGLEIDIYLPELKLGFEFNGLYWHSEKFKEKSYHLDKTNHFKCKDIRIVHIWEDDWIYRKKILESQIKNLLILNTEKIFARKCYIQEVAIKECRNFLDNNHIQGFVNSSLKLGLYYEEELVSIMTFDKFEGRKRMIEGCYNLNRFCNKLGTNVIGGASKLLNYFIKVYNPIRIVSYADKDWSVGDLYYKLGFKNIGGNDPDYKYIVDGCRVHKGKYRKSKLNTTLTESQEMIKQGICKIYDCGEIKFEIRI